MQIPMPRGARKVPGRVRGRGMARVRVLPKTAAIRGQSAPGVGFSRKDTSFGDKSISPGTPRAFPSGTEGDTFVPRRRLFPGEMVLSSRR